MTRRPTKTPGVHRSQVLRCVAGADNEKSGRHSIARAEGSPLGVTVQLTVGKPGQPVHGGTLTLSRQAARNAAAALNALLDDIEEDPGPTIATAPPALALVQIPNGDWIVARQDTVGETNCYCATTGPLTLAEAIKQAAK